MRYKRGTGGVGNLSPGARAWLMRLIAEEAPSPKIMELIGCTKQTVSFWRRQYHRDTSAPRIAHTRIAQLCLVNGCHEEASTGKYCPDHQHTPGQHGVQSHAPMARLMGSR